MKAIAVKLVAILFGSDAISPVNISLSYSANDQTSSVVTKVFQVQPCEVEKSPSLSQLSETVSLGDDKCVH